LKIDQGICSAPGLLQGSEMLPPNLQASALETILTGRLKGKFDEDARRWRKQKGLGARHVSLTPQMRKFYSFTSICEHVLHGDQGRSLQQQLTG
jgi:hypothetical protein